MSRVKIVTPKRKNPLGVATSKGAFHLVGLTVIVVPVKPLATATTAASGGAEKFPMEDEALRNAKASPTRRGGIASAMTERLYKGKPAHNQKSPRHDAERAGGREG